MWGNLFATHVLNNLSATSSAFLRLTLHPLFSASVLFPPTIEQGRCVLELRPRSRLPASGQTAISQITNPFVQLLADTSHTDERGIKGSTRANGSLFFFASQQVTLQPTQQDKSTHTHTHLSFRFFNSHNSLLYSS